MKELTIEQKAQRYDEALEKARQLCAYPTSKPFISDLQDLFPELKESEDEKIRKELIEFVKSRGGFKQEYIAWLEKQGEQNPYSGVSFKYNGHTWGMCARDNGVEILIDGHLKGRVFTNNDSNAKEMFIKALERVEEQNSKGYKLTDCDKNSWWEDFKAYTPYTIEQKPQGKTALEAINEEKVDNANKVESIDKYEGFTDFERTLADICISWIGEEPGYKQYIKDNADVLLKIAIKKSNSVQDNTFKGAWSEEDEKMFNVVHDLAWESYKTSPRLDIPTFGTIDNWLKYLKERVQLQSQWKPSDEQMSALSKAIASVFDSNSDVKHSLESLYNELKKL